jgi:hypothetical protein
LVVCDEGTWNELSHVPPFLTSQRFCRLSLSQNPGHLANILKAEVLARHRLVKRKKKGNYRGQGIIKKAYYQCKLESSGNGRFGKAHSVFIVV